MKQIKTITLLLGNIGAGDVIIELFHALANRCESYAASHLNVQPGFISSGIPLLTAEGILQAAVPNVNGLIYWLNDRMYGTDNTGTKEWNIQAVSNFNYSYRSMLSWLCNRKIKVGKVKLQGNAMADINNSWTLRRYYFDGTKYSRDIVITNSIPPQQVQSNILEFNLDEIIDGDTALEVLVKANTSYSIVFEFEEI